MADELVRSAEEASPHGTDPGERPIEDHLDLGAVFLDKPVGPTSHQVAAWLRDLLGSARAGHAGTLDPHVSGVLATAVGRATKALEALKGAEKEYVAVLRLHRAVPEPRLRAVLGEFVGEIYQMPPAKSAVARRLRRRRIHRLVVEEVDPADAPRVALLRVACDAGTYIRKLCTDVGLVLGAKGHMDDLRRTRAGRVDEKRAVSLHDVKDAHDHWKATGEEAWLREVVRPVEDLLEGLPGVVLRHGAVDAVCHGAPLHAPGVARISREVAAGDVVVLRSARGEAVAVGVAAVGAADAATVERGVVARPTGVLMRPGSYPRGWSGTRGPPRT